MSAQRAKKMTDPLSRDVMTVCERIHALARERGWDLRRLAKEADGPFQSFNNWKQGHELPKISNLQSFARAVDASVRVLLQDAQHPTGGLEMASDESIEIAAMLDGLEESQRRKIRDMVARHIAYSGGTTVPLAPGADGAAPGPRVGSK